MGVIAILAIGLGATTVVLSAVEALVLRPMPVADPKALVVIQERREGPGQMNNLGASAFRYDRYLSYRDATAGVFTNIAAQVHATFSIRIGNETRSAGGLVTSGSYFDVLGVRPALGRFYDSQIDTPGGAQAVVVLGYDFWQGTLNRDSSIIGKTLISTAAQCASSRWRRGGSRVRSARCSRSTCGSRSRRMRSRLFAAGASPTRRSQVLWLSTG